MNRLIALGFSILVLAMSAAVWLWLSRSSPEAPAAPLPELDYATSEAWATRPIAQPAAVWEGGWAIDVLLVLDAAARVPAPLKSMAAQEGEAIDAATSLGQGLSTIGPVYAPFYSKDAFSADIARAFEAYLASDNRGRAFIFATDRALPEALVETLNADTMLRERFGGIIRLSPTADPNKQFEVFADGTDPAAYCPDRSEIPPGCVASVLTKRKSGRRVIADAPPIGGIVTDGFLDWLETNAVQLAEPLGELEEVEIVEIRRPGETDPDADADREPAPP